MSLSQHSRALVLAAGLMGLAGSASGQTITKSFAKNKIPRNGTTTMTVTIAAGSADLSGFAFIDNLPTPGLIVTANGTNNCGGTASNPGVSPSVITYTGGSVLANQTCTVDFTVKGTFPSSPNPPYQNFISGTAPGSFASVVSPPALIEVVDPTWTKAFPLAPIVGGFRSIPINAKTPVVFTLNNNTGTDLSPVNFTDFLPGGFTAISAPAPAVAPASVNCGVPVYGGLNTGTFTVTNGTVLDGTVCTITVWVQATGQDSVINFAQGTAGGILEGRQATALLNVLAPAFSKTFSPTSIPLNGTTTMSISITNNTGTTLANAGFTDPMPSGLVITSVTPPMAPCVLPHIVGSLPNSLDVSGGTVPDNTTCTIVVQVKAVAGVAPSSTNLVTGAGDMAGVQRSALLTVTSPGFTKTPGITPLLTGDSSSYTLTLTNNFTSALPDVRFTDTLPSGLTLTTATSTCPAPAHVVNTAGNTFSLPAFSLNAPGSCTVTVNFTADTSGSKINTATGQGDLLGINPQATVVVNRRPPTFTKTFAAPKTITVGTNTTMTLFIENKTGAPIDANFNDTLPAGMQYVSSSATCTVGSNGTVTPPVGAPPEMIVYTRPSLPHNASCTVVVTVKGMQVGTWKNTAVGQGADLIGFDPFDTLVVGDVIFSKKFAASPTNLNATTTLTFTIDNTNGIALGQPMGFTDDLASLGLTSTFAAFNPVAPCTGSVSVAANVVTYNSTTAPSLAAGAICTFSIPVVGATAGTKNNVANGTGALAPKTAPDTLIVNKAPLTFTKTFNPKVVALNGASTMTLVISNTSGALAPNAAFSDTFPAGVKYVSIASNVCVDAAAATIASGAVTPPVGAPPEILGYARPNLPNGASCTITINVTGSQFGSWKNTATGQGDLLGIDPMDTLVVGEVLFSKMFTPPAIDYLAISTLKFTIDNTNGAALGQPMGFTDDLGFLNLTSAAAVFNPAAPCTGTVTVAGNIVTYSSTTTPALAAGAKCEFTIPVKGATSGIKNNLAVGTGSLAPKTAAAVLTVRPGTTSFLKEFSVDSIGPNTPFSVTFTLKNDSGVTRSDFGFDDDMSALGLLVDGVPTSNNCGIAPVAPIGGSMISITGVTLVNNITTPSSMCKFTIPVKGTSEGLKHNVAIGKGGFVGQIATDDVTILNNRFTKSFSPGAVIYTGAPLIVRLTWNITNVTGGALPGGFSDMLPAAFGTTMPTLKVATPPNALPNVATANCGPAFTPAAMATTVTFSGTVPAGATCTVSVDVEVPGVGFYHNVAVGTGLVNLVEAVADLDVAPPARKAYQLHYFSNLTAGDSVITLTNDGASSTMGTALTSQNGNLCINTYTYSPDEQLISCCSCAITPNALATLSVVKDLTFNPLTPIVPTSVVVKLLATRQGSSCNAAAVRRTDLRSGAEAWGATLHEAPVPLGGLKKYAITETRFVPGELSDAELTRMTGLCSFIQANGSGYGVCKSCRVAGLGAGSK